jgi:biopolymer transport protein ExbD
MGMSVSTGGGVKAEPNVVPMIDVMLVLLIIFMVVTPAITSGFTATPPDGVNLKQHPEDEQDQVLGIDRFGNYFINKKAISAEALPDYLKATYDNRTEDKVLYLKADRDLDYAKIIDAMDIASKAGVHVVGAITDQQIGTVSTVPGDVIGKSDTKKQ